MTYDEKIEAALVACGRVSDAQFLADEVGRLRDEMALEKICAALPGNENKAHNIAREALGLLGGGG